MKKTLGFGTLESRIYMIFTLMIFAAVFVMQLVSFRFTMNTVRNSTLENNRILLGQLVTQIDSYITGMEQISHAVQDDLQLVEYLKEGKNSTSHEYASIQQRLGNYIQARDDISDIIIVGHNGAVIAGDPETALNPWTTVSEKEWYTDAINADGQTVVSSSYVQNIVAGRYSWVVSLSREIFSMNGHESLGVLLVDLKFNRIKDLCQSLVVGRKGYNFIIDSERNYIFHPTQQLVYSDLRNEPINSIYSLLGSTEEKYYYANDKYFMIETSPITGWHIISVTYNSDIVTDWQYVQISYAFLGLVLFLIVGFATNRISSGITKPVRKLQEIMKSVDTGEFRLVGPIKATDEIRELAREYDTMVGHVRNLMEANIKEQELKRKSDLKALQAQINPHFLFNAINTIVSLVRTDPEAARTLLQNLSLFFRNSFQVEKTEVSIHQEIEHIRAYLEIEKARFGDKLKVEFLIPSSLEFFIPPFLLQPLVENAVKHGVMAKRDGGEILVEAKEEKKKIILTVEDNGAGMDAEQLKTLFENNNNESIALNNINKRLMTKYGEKNGLSIESRKGHGTKVTIRIPGIVK
ncbi:MAG: histidine kinase [Spirochaetales bacterium]|nr:histidine kinase [Spirochaetales bacterium]